MKWLAIALLLCVVPCCTGCQWLGEPPRYAFILDQYFCTRGAMEAVLGSYGILDVEWKISAHVKGDANDLLVRTLGVSDVDKDLLVKKLNQDEALLNTLNKNPAYRIVTAVAILKEHEQKKSRDVGAAVDGGAVTDSIEAQGNMRLLAEEETKIRGEPVYAYQMSHIEWDPGLGKIVGLKTDRPFLKDRFTRGIPCRPYGHKVVPAKPGEAGS